MEENKQQQPVEEQEIDLLELARKLWNARRLIIKWCVIGAVVGLVVAFSIPKEYTTTVKLSPELQGSKSASGGLSSLASMAGINLNSMNTVDAVNPELYPDVVSSIPFITELFNVSVTDKKGELQTTVYDYLSEHNRIPWWSVIFNLPGRLIGWCFSLFKEKDDINGDSVINPFRLKDQEMAIVQALNNRIICSVDNKSYVVTLSVTMQDPLISATLTDTVMTNLQRYITDYRTNKSRNDLAYTQKLFDEARANYYKAQQNYAQYMDQNQNVVLRSVRTEQDRLQNEMNLAFNVYSQMAQQLQMAKAKVQENTPVYAVIQPTTVPLKASKPSKMTILIGFIFLAAAASAGWALFGRELIDRLYMK